MNAFTMPAKGIDLGRTKTPNDIRRDAVRVNKPNFSIDPSPRNTKEKLDRLTGKQFNHLD